MSEQQETPTPVTEQQQQQQQQIDQITEGVEEVILGEDGKPLSKKALKKLEKEREKEKKKQERLAREAAERAARESAEVDYAKAHYGLAPMNMSQRQTNTQWTAVKDLGPALAGQTVHIQARVQTSRATGNKMCFLVLREGTSTVQGLLVVNPADISKQMVKFASSISSESIVSVTAVVACPEEPIKSCTVGDVELHVTRLFVTSEVKSSTVLPFSLEDASRSEIDYERDPTLNRVNLDTRLNNRVIDLRTTTNNAIFKIQAAVCLLFREFLDKQGFTEIHSPKIISTASEGGANVFRVTYFKDYAYLAQSPQLYKQACIAADFGKVYEIAPVFRAEDSNTHRHLTEYIGLDLECAFREHYHEVMNMIGEMFVYIFKNLEERWAHELATVRKQYPMEKICFDEKPLRLEYKDAVALLRKHGEEIGDYDDFSTPQEKKLGKLEIMSGAQRIHDADFLRERVIAHGVDPKSLEHYIKGFEYGCPPHAGGGVGLERVVMFYLGLHNIRRTSLFPRDPKRMDP
ncbi:aspartate--tRNA ligase dps1 [Coemansia sp. Benny D115]|nr:aspartate--tRNA ligase dps1 [Coemansia sp. Benny D115]